MSDVALEQLVIDNMAEGLFRVNRRVFTDPDILELEHRTAWALAPKEETPENRALRLDNFLTFLGPGGFATPDDVEMLESCQRGFANREVVWSDISRGMKREQPLSNDELQMRAFWRQWYALMTLSQPAEASARPALAV